jgi:hypothetical protein
VPAPKFGRCGLRPPEVLEPVRRQGQGRVDRRARDRSVAEPSLDRPCAVALVGERVAAGVTEHVRMRLELEAGAGGGTLDHSGKGRRREGEPRSLTKTKGDGALSRWSRRRARSSSPTNGCVLGIPFSTCTRILLIACSCG